MLSSELSTQIINLDYMEIHGVYTINSNTSI